MPAAAHHDKCTRQPQECKTRAEQRAHNHRTMTLLLKTRAATRARATRRQSTASIQPHRRHARSPGPPDGNGVPVDPMRTDQHRLTLNMHTHKHSTRITSTVSTSTVSNQSPAQIESGSAPTPCGKSIQKAAAPHRLDIVFIFHAAGSAVQHAPHDGAAAGRRRSKHNKQGVV